MSTQTLKNAATKVGQDIAANPAVKGSAAFIMATALVTLLNLPLSFSVNGIRELTVAEMGLIANGIAAAIAYFKK